MAFRLLPFPLKKHVLTVHKGMKPFQCEFCVKQFTTKLVKNLHVDSVHEQKKPFKCETCDYSSSYKANLKRHAASVH